METLQEKLQAIKVELWPSIPEKCAGCWYTNLMVDSEALTASKTGDIEASKARLEEKAGDLGNTCINGAAYDESYPQSPECRNNIACELIPRPSFIDHVAGDTL